MSNARALLIVLLLAGMSLISLGAEEMQWHLEAPGPQGYAEYDDLNKVWIGTNGVFFTYSNTVLNADSMTVDAQTGDIFADGSVRIQHEEQLWVGEHIRYNFKTRQMEARQFRTGKPPVFVQGEGLHAEGLDTNQTSFSATNLFLRATNAFLTVDDISDPDVIIRAKSITVIPNQKVISRQATLYVRGIPVFYWAYYERNLGPRANNFNFIPGYRSSYGAFLLNSYQWYLNDQLDAILHADYRTRRGPGLGPDLNYHLGQWGEGSIRYYYLHDYDPRVSISITNGNFAEPPVVPQKAMDLPSDRQRVNFSWLANPYTNLSFRSQIRYQSDLGVLHDFFEREYRANPQPNSFLEADKTWQNFSLDLYAQPRLNDFLETVERLPDVRLTGYRQQLWELPLYYESETSAGYYRRRFAETNQLFPFVGPYTTNGAAYAASRFDSFHQITMPETFFGWLNFTPRAGGRFTYYGSEQGPGAMTDEAYRGVFNTGAELSFKASRVWPGFESKLFEMDGLRHIIEPSLNYTYVPRPNRIGTNEIPQFDFELPSVRLLPADFPEYNSIDSIDSENFLRLGLRNKFQTKRQGQVVDVLDWDLYTDWRFNRSHDFTSMLSGPTAFSDVYSDLAAKPWSWLTFESLTRFSSTDGDLRVALHTLTFQPNTTWSWSLSHFYLRDLGDQPTNSPIYLGESQNVLASSFFFRLNENWGARATQRYDIREGRMQEQIYSVYRDFRGWTGALSFRLRDNPSGPEDFGVSFTFSIKAFPRYQLGNDAVRPYYLLGY